MAAVDRPVNEPRRRNLVRNYSQLRGENPLSNTAFVFREKYFGQFQFSRGQNEVIRPEQGETGILQVYNSEYNYIDPRTGQRGDAEVEALGGVEVDDDGNIVDIIAVHRNVEGGRNGLIAIMNNAGWRMNLREPPSTPRVIS